MVSLPRASRPKEDFVCHTFSLSDIQIPELRAEDRDRFMVMDTTSSEPGTTAPPSEPAAARPAVIMQVLPALVTGGVERGTLDVAAAIVRAGGTALVASA